MLLSALVALYSADPLVIQQLDRWPLTYMLCNWEDIEPQHYSIVGDCLRACKMQAQLVAIADGSPPPIPADATLAELFGIPKLRKLSQAAGYELPLRIMHAGALGASADQHFSDDANYACLLLPENLAMAVRIDMLIDVLPLGFYEVNFAAIRKAARRHFDDAERWGRFYRRIRNDGPTSAVSRKFAYLFMACWRVPAISHIYDYHRETMRWLHKNRRDPILRAMHLLAYKPLSLGGEIAHRYRQHGLDRRKPRPKFF